MAHHRWYTNCPWNQLRQLVQLQRLSRTTPGPVETVSAAPEAHGNAVRVESVAGRAGTRDGLPDFIDCGAPVVSTVVAEGHITPGAHKHLGTGRPQRAVTRRGHPACDKGSMHLTVSLGEILDVRTVALLDERL